jgi:hypothetical protein
MDWNACGNQVRFIFSRGLNRAILTLCYLIRWLYSSCRNCEICEINHTACPYQKNAGAVSADSVISQPIFLEDLGSLTMLFDAECTGYFPT